MPIPNYVQTAIDALQTLEPADIKPLDDEALALLHFWIAPVATLVEYELFRRRCEARRMHEETDA